jgi:hypothetical protein
MPIKKTKPKNPKKSKATNKNKNSNVNKINININTGSKSKSKSKKGGKNKNVVSGVSTGGLNGPDNKGGQTPALHRTQVKPPKEDNKELISKVNELIEDVETFNNRLTSQNNTTKEVEDTPDVKPALIKPNDDYYGEPKHLPDLELKEWESVGNGKFEIHKNKNGKIEARSTINSKKASIRELMAEGGATETDI